MDTTPALPTAEQLRSDHAAKMAAVVWAHRARLLANPEAKGRGAWFEPRHAWYPGMSSKRTRACQTHPGKRWR